MVRALIVLRLCQIQSLVKNAGKLLEFGEKVLGRNAVKILLRSGYYLRQALTFKYIWVQILLINSGELFLAIFVPAKIKKPFALALVAF